MYARCSLINKRHKNIDVYKPKLNPKNYCDEIQDQFEISTELSTNIYSRNIISIYIQS